MTADARALRALARTLKGTRWCLFGARAVIAWSVPRTTHDIDVTVEVDDRRAFVQRVLADGFSCRLPPDKRDALVDLGFIFPATHTKSDVDIDFVFAGSGFDAGMLAAAVPMTIAGRRIPVAKAEHLVVQKIIASRPMDLQDVRALIDTRGDALDHAEILDLLEQFERALNVSDLVPSFHDCVRTSRS